MNTVLTLITEELAQGSPTAVELGSAADWAKTTPEYERIHVRFALASAGIKPTEAASWHVVP